MKTIHYLAYGSNLHPVRLKQRVPSSRSIGWLELPEYALRFHKQGIDDSGKCDAFFTGNKNDLLYGAVYSMRADERHLLDAAEGLGNGYNLQQSILSMNTDPLEVFFYVADSAFIDEALRPYDWYKALVIKGANLHHLPPAYIQKIRDVIAQKDIDQPRTNEHLAILNSAP